MSLQEGILHLVLPLLGLAMALTFVRLVRGPSLPDRVVAMELLTTIAVGMFAAYAVLWGDSVVLDIGLIVALVSFLGTVAIAYAMQQRRNP
jgi:multicomponent Na+:H+ antiporter subunit F